MLRVSVWRAAASSAATWSDMKAAVRSQLDAMPEQQQLKALAAALRGPEAADHFSRWKPAEVDRLPLRQALVEHPAVITPAAALTILDAAIMTFLLHVESRAASLLGHGFYTIGPCGEELMAALGVTTNLTDPLALHYRHLSTQIARRLREGKSPQEILLARARAFCVSAKDVVTGGAHCALGGGPFDFIVTSTLASQMCPAVGRALGGSLAHHLKLSTPFPSDFVSVVSLGDGSVNNGHYLSGENLANYVAYRNHKVPLVTCITDNGLSISFRNHGYLQQSFAKRWQCRVLRARGTDIVDLWLRSHEAVSYARVSRKPSVLLVTDLTRRFGHAATDRQAAYLSQSEIVEMQSSCVLKRLFYDLLEANVLTKEDLATRFEELQRWTSDAFDAAHREPKLTSRSELLARVSAPLAPMPPPFRRCTPSDARPETSSSGAAGHVIAAEVGTTGAAAQVLRKHMTRVFDDAMAAHSDVVYVGEDVQHGGYYMVTDGLAKKYPHRVQDFPPDETSIVGIALGYRQSGLLPIIEIPYAKYLDCALDMFTEVCIMHWLSNGRQANGLVFRLQGFGRGVFGGNYHTHNMLHMPPGLDVVCYSNGRDYSRGMRYALQQARAGRVSMFVDCTELLNLREADAGVSWEMPYTAREEFCTYDDVFLYPSRKNVNLDASRRLRNGDAAAADPVLRVLVVTYGGGVPLALQAQRATEASISVDVCDCPLLSSCPAGLEELLGDGSAAVRNNYDAVLFADICKEGQHPLATHMTHLINTGYINGPVRCVAAQRTYNPLGTVLTFLSKEDILEGLDALCRSARRTMNSHDSPPVVTDA